MGNYSNNESSVRVDFFKPSGKWVATEELDMERFYFGSNESAGKRRETPHYLLPEAILEAMRVSRATYFNNLGEMRYAGLWAVCLDPYHEYSHPQMFLVPEK